MLRHAVNTTPTGSNHGYNANDFLEESSSLENEDDNDDDDDVTLRAPLPNFHMFLHQGSPAETTTAMDYTTRYRQEVLLKNHDDCIRPFISALLVSCRVLRLSMETTFTAACLLHRFAIAHSSLKNHPTQLHHHDKDDDTSENHHNDKHEKNNDDDWRWIIASCIFLACKVEEEPRRLRDLINMAHMITFHNTNNNNNNDALQDNVTPSNLNKKQQQVNHQASLSDEQRQNNATTSTTTTGGGASSSSVAALLYWESEPPDLDSRYWQAKETLVKAEQNVLRWLAFDVTVSHPHRAVVVLLSQQQQPDFPENTMSSATSQRNGSNKPEVVNIQQQQQQQRPVSSLPADAATGTLMMQVNGKGRDTQEQKEQQHHHDLAHLAWTILNNTVFYVEALRHDVIALAMAALEMAQEQQQSQFAVPVHESAPTTGTAAAADDDDNDDTAKQKDICSKEADVVAARPVKKQKSEKTIENYTNAAIASARRSLQEALSRVQRLSEMSTTFTTSSLP